MDIKKRIEALESRIMKNDENETQGIFYIVVDASAEAPPIEEQEKIPVKGWLFQYGKEEIRIIRRDGETDEELDQRAISEAKPLLRHPLAIPVFFPITELSE